MEKCNYCGLEYHPMPRWTRRIAPTLIYVCNQKLVMDGNGNFVDIVPWAGCEESATEDGYTKRMDLTPRR